MMTLSQSQFMENSDEDAFLEFCAVNYLDPNSKRAQMIWAEQLEGYDSAETSD